MMGGWWEFSSSNRDNWRLRVKRTRYGDSHFFMAAHGWCSIRHASESFEGEHENLPLG